MAQRPSSQIEVLSSNGGTDSSSSDLSSTDRPQSRFRRWHAAGVVLLFAVGGLLLYGFWPVLLATVFLVFLITAAVFESWRLPLVVMLSLPLAGIGVALGFLWSEIPFAEGAFIGMVLLIGIAVNDSILLTDRFRQLRALRPHTATNVLARLAVRERLRPMWTTTLSTIVAMLPLLVFPDGSEFWMGLAITVTGGLLAATLLVPFATVALLCWRRPLRSLRGVTSPS